MDVDLRFRPSHRRQLFRLLVGFLPSKEVLNQSIYSHMVIWLVIPVVSL
jgi:hypothetical protein